MRRRLVSAIALLAPVLGSVLVSLTAIPNVDAATPAWLDRLNQWRAAAGVPLLSENTTWDQGDYNHSLYMVKNDQVTHYEVSSLPYYTAAGDTAARNGNIEVNSTTAFTDQQAIDWWMAAPFHELGMMDPRLSQTGFGSYREVKSGWQAGFTLDTVRGNSFAGGAYPVFFPGKGASEPLTSYQGNEFPDPLQGCSGYAAPTGLPVTIQVGGFVGTSVTASSFSTGGTQLAHCVIDSSNPTFTSYLQPRGAAILIPRAPLLPGTTYSVALTVNGVPYSWSFTVSSGGVITPGGQLSMSLGGLTPNGPGTSSWAATRTDVFVRGGDNQLWQQAGNGTAWSGWAPLGGIITAAPSAVSWGPNRIDVVARGGDGALWHRSSDGTSWSGWEWLGGGLRFGPTVASWGPNRLDIFGVGLDGQLWNRSWTGTSWTPWQPLGGILTARPAAVSWGANRIDVFGRGADGQMWHLAWNGSQWSGWQPMAGGFTSGPAASSCASGHLDVFALGLDHGLWRDGWNGSQWSGWQPLGDYSTADPAAVCTPGTTTVQIFERASDQSVIEATTTGS